MPILVESNRVAVSSAPSYGCGPSSESCRPAKLAKKPTLVASPAKRRLNFDDPASPAKPLFTHPAADRSDSCLTTTKSPCVFVDEELQKVAKQATERWNFDFVKGVPLQGRFQWESAVTRSPIRETPIAQGTGVDRVFDETMDIVDVDAMTGAFVTPSPKTATLMSQSVQRPGSARQLLITDAFMCRKRRSSMLTSSSAIDKLPLAENKARKSKRSRLSML